MTTKTIQKNEAGEPTGLIVFTFDDKTTATFDISGVPDAIKLQLMLHGASQKIGDSYASAASQEDPLGFAKASVKATIENLYAGTWRSNAGVGGARYSDLVVALSRVTGKTTEECDAFVDTLDDDQKKAWRNKGKVKAAILQITAERAADKAKKAAEAAAKGAVAKPDADAEEEEITIPEVAATEG